MFSRVWEEAAHFDTPFLWRCIDDVYVKSNVVYDKKNHQPLNVTHVFPFYFSFEEERFAPVLKVFKEGGCIVSRQGVSPLSDKWQASKLFAECDVPHPKTWLVENVAHIKPMFSPDQLYVLKPKCGKQGDGVVLVKSFEELQSLMLLDVYHQGALLQSLITPIGRDIRAFVIGNEVVASMERWAPLGELVTNYSKHHSAKPILLTKLEKALAVKATKVGGLHYAGVDLMRHENGKTYVLEVNARPAIAIEDVTGVNIAKKWLEYFICLNQGFLDGQPRKQAEGLQYPCGHTELQGQ